MRSVIFSDRDLAIFLGHAFECSWEAVKPVPQVWIDFGNGKKLHRTLMGNVATWFCTSDGVALDVLPGLCTLDDYRRRVEIAYGLHSLYRQAKNPREFLAQYHATKQELTTAGAAELLKASRKMGRELDFSKRRIERPIKIAVRDALRRVLRMESGVLARKVREAGPEILRRDGDYNRRYREPRTHELLARRAGSKIDALTNSVFKIMEVDLEDPYLGLAPYVLGGKLGRHGD